MSTWITPRSALATGLLAAVGASVCCVLPLVLVTVGIGGAWVSSLTVLAPLQPFFVLLTVVSFALAYRRLYRTECAADKACAASAAQRRQRAIFWLAAAVVAPVITFPWYAELFY